MKNFLNCDIGLSICYSISGLHVSVASRMYSLVGYRVSWIATLLSLFFLPSLKNIKSVVALIHLPASRRATHAAVMVVKGERTTIAGADEAAGMAPEYCTVPNTKCLSSPRANYEVHTQKRRTNIYEFCAASINWMTFHHALLDYFVLD